MSHITVQVRVKPGASRTHVGGSYGDPPQLVVAVNAQAVDGKANEAVCQAVADALGVKPRNIEIMNGRTSRTKRLAILVTDADIPLLQIRVAALLVN